MLQPFGKHLILAQRDAEDYDDTAEDFDSRVLGDSIATPQPHPLETDLEDVAGEEELVEKYDSFFKHNGDVCCMGMNMKV